MVKLVQSSKASPPAAARSSEGFRMIDKSREYRENKAVKKLMEKLIAAENEALSPDDGAEKKTYRGNALLLQYN